MLKALRATMLRKGAQMQDPLGSLLVIGYAVEKGKEASGSFSSSILRSGYEGAAALRHASLRSHRLGSLGPTDYGLKPLKTNLPLF